MNVDLGLEAVDPAQHPELFDDLQGNILKGHGKESVRLLLVQFVAPQAEARMCLARLGYWVTVASQQNRQTNEWKRRRRDEAIVNVFLTAPGYRYVGVPDSEIPADGPFLAGMAASRDMLKDPSLEERERPFDKDTEPIHAMVLVAAGHPSVVDKNCNTIAEGLKSFARVTPQDGQAIRDKSGDPDLYVEHLNYIDGASQPLFLRSDVERAAKARGNTAAPLYDPAAPLSLVLVKEPDAADGKQRGYGSYLVYRKLEQRVRAFKMREGAGVGPGPSSVADELGFPLDDTRRRVGALALGRFENGTPIVSAAVAEPNLKQPPNDFNYEGDADGSRCPLFAHIRKVNPRTSESRMHRIARRGITYNDTGESRDPSVVTYEHLPEGNVGLLFMCFQSSIGAQFEHLQQLANDATHGVDPIAGQTGDSALQPLAWPTEWGRAARSPAPFGGFAVLKGGEYFFAPSKSFFNSLVA